MTADDRTRCACGQDVGDCDGTCTHAVPAGPGWCAPTDAVCLCDRPVTVCRAEGACPATGPLNLLTLADDDNREDTARPIIVALSVREHPLIGDADIEATRDMHARAALHQRALDVGHITCGTIVSTSHYFRVQPGQDDDGPVMQDVHLDGPDGADGRHVLYEVPALPDADLDTVNQLRQTINGLMVARDHVDIGKVAQYNALRDQLARRGVL